MANIRISDLSPAGPILGPELVPVVQGSPLTTLKSTAASLVAGALPLGHRFLSTNATFDSIVANAPLTNDYEFGTGVASAPGVTPIRNLTDLAVYFNPLEDFTNLITINGEIQRYQAFNSSNHAFLTDRLNLWGLNPNADWNVQVSQVSTSVNLNGTSTVIANLGLANTTGLRVGQVVVVEAKGTYYISALVVNTSVTLTQLGGSPTSAVTSGLIFWLNVDSAVTTVDYTINVGVTLTFAATPAGVNGRQMALYDGSLVISRNNDYRIVAADATTVTLNTPWSYSNITAGGRILFIPVVTSGQIWSKQQIDITNPQTFFAAQADVELLSGPSREVRTLGVTTLAAFNALPNDVPWGAWPAFWCYSADNGTDLSTSIAEIDIVEIMYSESQDIANLNSGNAGGAATQVRFTKTNAGWAYNSTFGISSKTDGTTFAGAHKWQLIHTNGATYRFWDGVLYNVKAFQWAGQRALQFSAGLAVGSIKQNLASNVLFPMFPTSFNGMNLGVKSIKIWYQPP
jgi:hypothetical protein